MLMIYSNNLDRTITHIPSVVPNWVKRRKAPQNVGDLTIIDDDESSSHGSSHIEVGMESPFGPNEGKTPEQIENEKTTLRNRIKILKEQLRRLENI